MVPFSVQIFNSQLSGAYVTRLDLIRYVGFPTATTLVILICASIASPPTEDWTVISTSNAVITRSHTCTFDQRFAYLLYAWLAAMIGFGIGLGWSLRDVVRTLLSSAMRLLSLGMINIFICDFVLTHCSLPFSTSQNESDTPFTARLLLRLY